MTRSILRVFAKMVNMPLNMFGLALVQASKQAMPTWKDRIELAKRLGFSPRYIFDGGAFQGLWTQEAARLFPGAEIVVVEPNPNVLDNIKKNIAHIDPAPSIVNVALGDRTGKAKFNIWRDVGSDTGASLLSNVSGEAANVIEVDVDTVDNISKRTAMVPDLLKLDLQGGELAALKGATEVLKHAECVVVEFGCLEAYVGRTTPRDLMEILYDNDYCLYDIVDCHYRPYDRALTGGDFVFVKNDSILRKHKGWD